VFRRGDDEKVVVGHVVRRRYDGRFSLFFCRMVRK
jgi:hypothetical protein